MKRLRTYIGIGRLSVFAGAVIAAGCGHSGVAETSSHNEGIVHDLSPGAGVDGTGKSTGSATPAAASAAEAAAMVSVGQEVTQQPPPSIAPRVACEARLGTDGLRRAAVNRTLDAGLGNWLRGVDIDPKLERGRFRGWIVRNLPEDVCYVGLELQVGDVVTRINGRHVERPEEAKDIWDGLRTSPALVIDFLRDGHPRTLRFDILDR